MALPFALLSADGLYLYINKINFPTSIDSFLKSPPPEQAAVGSFAVLAALSLSIAVNKLYGSDPLGRSGELLSKFAVQEKKRKINVNEMIDGYNNLHDDDKVIIIVLSS